MLKVTGGVFFLRNEEGVVLRMWAELQHVFIRVVGLSRFILKAVKQSFVFSHPES